MSVEEQDLVTLSVTHQVAEVKLNRPQKYNALSRQMMQSIADVGKTLSGRDDVRVVLLSGEGPGFCAGLDRDSFQAMEQSSGKQKESSGDIVRPVEGSWMNLPQHVAYIWKTLPVPVIVALHGVAYGGGLQIALGADIRIASPDARFSVMEIKWGLIPDMSFTQTIRDILPMDKAKELMFTGRVISAEEALKLNLVTKISQDCYAEAKALAEEIASKNPDAIRAGKKLLEDTWHGTPRESLALEEKLQLELIGSDNQVEAIKANFEKRPPKFS